MEPLYTDIVDDPQQVRQILYLVVQNRIMGRLEVPNTHESWLTLILGFADHEGQPCMALDMVSGLDAVLQRANQSRVAFHFAPEQGGVPHMLQAEVVAMFPEAILVTMPMRIRRVQRRDSFRLESRGRSQAIFLTPDGQPVRAALKNYSAGGACLVVDPRTPLLAIGDVLADLQLDLAGEAERLNVTIPAAKVRWRQTLRKGGAMYGVQYSGVNEASRRRLLAHMFNEQRANRQLRG